MKLWTICGIIISSAILAVQGGPGEHEKIVACYWGAWSVYRYPLAIFTAFAQNLTSLGTQSMIL
jgi:hypothetical protein